MTRQPFPELLTDVCTNLAGELNARRAVLLLYDDVARAFAAVAVAGSGSDPVQSITVMGAAAERLLELLQAGTPRRLERSDDFFVDEAASLERWLGDRAALVVPLREGSSVGLVVLSAGDDVFDPDRVQVVAQIAARRIAAGRPDLGHDCLFRSLLDFLPGGAAVLEGERHGFSFASAALRGMLSAEPVPFLGRTLSDVISGADDGELLEHVAEVRRSGEAFHAANLQLTDRYGPRFYEVHLLPQAATGECPAAILLILWPRTEVVAIRQALESSAVKLAESQGLLAAVLNATDQGIILVGTDMTVLYANRRIAELLGLEITEVIGRDRRHAIEPYLSPRSGDHHNAEETWTDELELARPVHRILERYGAPVYTDEGVLLGHIEVYSDVTDVRQLQRNKDEFLSVVSHELRTPVTSIKGYAQLLQRRADREPTSEGTRAAYSTIERQSKRMQELIDMLLDLTRLEQGRLRLQLAEVNLGDLVTRAAEMVQMTTELHTIELQLQARPTWIIGDEHRLEQVLLNLLSNAIRYSPEGGTVTVTLGQLDGAVRIAIEDRGVGIAPDALPHIFERFYRVGDESAGAGLGVGLYITQRIVEQHGGSINVSSELGRGSTFVLTLPAQPHTPDTTDV